MHPDLDIARQMLLQAWEVEIAERDRLPDGEQIARDLARTLGETSPNDPI